MSKTLAKPNSNLNCQKTSKMFNMESENKNEDLFECKCVVLTVLNMALTQITLLLIS